MILPVGRPRANNANQPFAKNDEKSPSRSPVKVHDEAGFPFPVRYPSEGLELGRGRGISNLDKKARITRPAPLI